MKQENLTNAIYHILVNTRSKYDIGQWAVDSITKDKKHEYKIDNIKMMYDFLERLNRPDFTNNINPSEEQKKHFYKSYKMVLNCRVKYKMLLRSFTEALKKAINKDDTTCINNYVNNQKALFTLATRRYSDEPVEKQTTVSYLDEE